MVTGFEQYTKKTRRAIFLQEMEQVVPWRELCALVEPHYPAHGLSSTANATASTMAALDTFRNRQRISGKGIRLMGNASFADAQP